MSRFSRTPPARVAPSRLWVFAVGLLLWASYVVVTLHDLQMTQSGAMRALVRRQHEQVIQADPRRGSIVDRMGRSLAVSTDVYSVYAAPEEIKPRDHERAVAGLAKALSLPASQVRSRLVGDGFVLLRRRVSPDIADRVSALKVVGVHLVAESKRFYPHGSLAAHVLGFVVPDEPAIREGLEKRYDNEIRGTPGALVASRDAAGNNFLMEARREPVPGRDLVTSLDEVIQHVAERELARAIEETGSRSGSVVVLRTRTGEILALANHPTFNPNLYRLSQPAERRNRAVIDYYEPGSTFKIITAAAALEEGLVRPSEVIDCQMGLVRIAGIPIHDHKPFPVLPFADVIAKSSNIGALKVGMRIDPRTFHEHIARFGFGSRTGVDLPGESRGMLRPASKWAATSEAYISFGQEIGVTPLQLASAFSTVANRGVAVAPRVVTKISDPEGGGAREPERPPPRRVISEATADILIDLMEGVVTYGTGEKAAVPGYRVAGKTGTAQKIVDGVYASDKYVSSFCGFVPSRSPVLTILVVLDEPKGAYHGGEVAAPVFRWIAAPVLDYLGVPRDESQAQRIDLASLGAGMSGVQMEAAGSSDPAAVMSASLVTRRSSTRKKPADQAPEDPVLRPVAPRPLDLRADPAAARGERPEAGAQGIDGVVTVPDLSGAPLRDAVVLLARAGLVVSILGEGFVVTQDPAAGSVVERGSEVALTLGRFLEEVKEPEPRDR